MRTVNFVRQQEEPEPCALLPTLMTFLENHGKNIQLSNQSLTAARVSSYNQGLLVTAQPLARQQLFQVIRRMFTLSLNIKHSLKHGRKVQTVPPRVM